MGRWEACQPWLPVELLSACCVKRPTDLDGCPALSPVDLQASSAEVAWGLKARVHEWSPQVAAWLHALHTSAGGGGASNGGSPASPGPAAGSQEWQQLTLGVVRCFAAWAKWGALQYVEGQHAAYLARLAGELLFAPQPASSPLFAAAVDAATEVVDHATPTLQPLLLQLAAALPARAAALCCAGDGSGEAAAEELAHVFALFCSTNCALCMAEGPEGQAMRQVGHVSLCCLHPCALTWSCACPQRSALASHAAGLPMHPCRRAQGLLQLLALPLEPGSDGGGAALPAMGALCDLLEHAVAQHRGEHASEEEGEEAGGARCGCCCRAPAPGVKRAVCRSARDGCMQHGQPQHCCLPHAPAQAAGPRRPPRICRRRPRRAAGTAAAF